MRALCVLLLGAFAGCAYPVEQVMQVEPRPAVLVEGAPADAVLIVDGRNLGPVHGTDGNAQAIRIESGTHDIQVSVGGATLLAERIFVSGAAVKTISFSGQRSLQ